MRVFRLLALAICGCAAMFLSSCSQSTDADNDDDNNNTSGGVTIAITHDTTWTSGAPPLVQSITITNGTLTLLPHTVVQMAADGEIDINTGGGLVADSVTFTGATAQAGYWRYIWFASNAATVNCRLTNCVIEYGGGASTASAMIYCDDASPTIRNCVIRHSSSYGVYFGTASRPTFVGNTITGNTLAPVEVNFSGVALLDTGSYTGNTANYIEVYSGHITANATWRNLGVPYLVAGGDVTNSTLTINKGAVLIMSDAAEIDMYTGGGIVADSVTFTGQTTQPGFWRYLWFANNAANANCRLTNCTIEYGGGHSNSSAILYCDDASPTIRNCVIRHSSAYGVYFGTASRPSFIGNTVTSNTLAPVMINFAGVASLDTGNYSGNTNDYIEVNSGHITSNTTWRKLNVPYQVEGGDVTNATLTIQPGTTIRMYGDAEIDMYTGGALYAVGTSVAPITFTGSTQQKGWWRYLWFAGDCTEANSHLSYCTIEYGGGYSTGSAMIYSDNSGNPTFAIDHCTIRQSESWGVYYSGAHQSVIENGSQNTFSDNTEGNVTGN
jgi:parallel beta-helix repeat protein